VVLCIMSGSSVEENAKRVWMDGRHACYVIFYDSYACPEIWVWARRMQFHCGYIKTAASDSVENTMLTRESGETGSGHYGLKSARMRRENGLNKCTTEPALAYRSHVARGPVIAGLVQEPLGCLCAIFWKYRGSVSHRWYYC
jgi:hypothetical protein